MTRRIPRDRNLTDLEIKRWTAHITLNIREAMEQTIPVGFPGRGPMATMPKEIDQYSVPPRYADSRYADSLIRVSQMVVLSPEIRGFEIRD